MILSLFSLQHFECKKDFVGAIDDECVDPYVLQCLNNYCKCFLSRNWFEEYQIKDTAQMLIMDELVISLTNDTCNMGSATSIFRDVLCYLCGCT